MKCIELPKWIMFAGYGLTIGQTVFIRKGLQEIYNAKQKNK